jgi:hypothetical protein
MDLLTGGSLKILHSSGCCCIVVQCARTMFDKLLSEGWYVMTNGILTCCSILYCNANCKTENIIYLLECAIGGLQYVGETKHNNLVND